MNPIYKFTLAANGGDEQQAFPVWRDDVTKDFELQTNQEFYRAKLSGKLTFVRDDYDFIASKSFDTQFGLKIYISYDAGQTWTEYWSGNFWKTNCKFDENNKNLTVTPDVVDQYTDVLAGMEKEYNLIELAPEIVPVNLDKRPMIQVYVPGQTVIGCFLSGMWWEQECESILETQGETIGGVFVPDLQRIYHFAKNKTLRIADISGSMTPQLPDIMTAVDVNSTLWSISGGGFTLRYAEDTSDPEDNFTYYEIVRNSDNVRLWYCRRTNGYEYPPQDITLTPVSGSGATGNVQVFIHDVSVWARYVCDVESAMGLSTYPIPTDDIVENNRNYTRVIGYDFPNTIIFYDGLSTTPTQWGLYQPGLYYKMFVNPIMGINESYPVARNAWGRISLWFTFDVFDWITEQFWRKEYTLRDAYPLASVISVLLAQVAPGLTHQETTDYSRFLYGTNPLFGINQRIFITPKSNMILLGYDQPAQKAPVTLKRILDMLRDCFRCYWFVDDQNRFRIEHIEFFRRGGTYTGTPVVGRNLTVEQVTRNGKKWAFDTSQFEYDKPEMAARYQFGWMDDVTQLFEGNPIDIVSKYVNPGNIEQIEVSQFTSDVDYILLNPGEISKDGFVLLAAVRGNKQIGVEKFTHSGYIDVNGIAQPLGGWGYTDFLAIDAGTTITALLSPGSAGYIAFYSAPSENAFVGSWHANEGVQVSTTVPSNAKYFRASTGLNDTYSTVNYVYGLKLPYINFELNYVDHYLQNAYVAFIYLQQYYFWDMPARYFKYNGVQMAAQGIKKLKTQKLKFPAFNDPNTLQLIKTNLGNGTIQKMSVNLSSRNANTTLKYDTE